MGKRKLFGLTNEIQDLNTLVSDETEDGRVKKSTKDQYKGILVRLKAFCTVNILRCIDNNADLDLNTFHEDDNLILKQLLSHCAAEYEDGSIPAAQTISNIISSIKFEYRRLEIAIPIKTEAYFKSFMQGYKRKVQNKKDEGKMDNHEGKVTVLVYTNLCKLALFATKDTRSKFCSFVHVYLILCWNLFSRSISVTELRTHHMSWKNDALVIDFNSHKSDQTGERITPKHIFANPYEPEMCPILALGLHIFGISFRSDNEDKSKI